MTAELEARRTTRRFAWGVAGVLLLGLALRLHGLAAQPLSDDDWYVGLTAVRYVGDGQLGPTMWNHPQLRSLLVFPTLHAFGWTPWGLKLPSLLLGTLSILLLALVARQLVADARAALLAALLLALDPLHIDFSRQAVQEAHMMAFFLGGLLLALRSDGGQRPAPLLGAGLIFGLGLAAKWSVAFALAPTAGYLLWGVWRDAAPGSSPQQRLARGALILAALGVLPFVVQLLTYLPWLLGGHGLGEWLDLQLAMARETQVHRGYHAYQLELDTRALWWFLKPVAYVDTIFGAGEPTLLVAISSPLTWLLTLPAVALLSARWIRRRERRIALLLALFGCGYLPFALLRRPIWAHTAFAALPFALTAVASIVSSFAAAPRRRWLFGAYAALVALIAFPLYLLATGRGMELAPLRQIALLYRPSFGH